MGPTPGGTSPRSSGVPAPEPDTRNPTVKKKRTETANPLRVVVVSGRHTLALAGGSLTWKTPDWTDIYISFIFPLFLTFRLSMIMFKLSFTVLFRDIYEF